MTIYVQTTSKMYSLNVDLEYTSIFDVKTIMAEMLEVKPHLQILMDSTQRKIYKDHEFLVKCNIQKGDTLLLVFKC